MLMLCRTMRKNPLMRRCAFAAEDNRTALGMMRRTTNFLVMSRE